MGRKPKPINPSQKILGENEIRISLVDLNRNSNITEEIITKHIKSSNSCKDWAIVILDSLENYKLPNYKNNVCLLKIFFEALYIDKMKLQDIILNNKLTDETVYNDEPKFGESVIVIYGK